MTAPTPTIGWPGYCRDGRVGVDRHDFFLGLEAQRMQHAALAADEPVLDPELVVAGARGNVAVLGFCSRPRHSACIAPVSTRAIIRTWRCAERADERGDLLPHRVASRARSTAPESLRRILVIERGEAVEIAGVERLEPAADELKRIDGAIALRYFTGMKAHTKYLTLNIPSKMAFRNITPEVDEAVRASGVQEGLVLVNTMHITASVFINDDERGLHHDFGKWLEELAPFNPDPESLPSQPHRRRQRRRAPQAPDHGPRGGGRDHEGQARFRAVGADLLRRVRWEPEQDGC